MLAGETRLWTFVRVEGVEPTNNPAERALRHGVIYRKLSGGTDSVTGSRFVERMLSVVATCRQQGINVLDYLTRCYRAASRRRPRPFAPPDHPDHSAGLTVRRDAAQAVKASIGP